MIIDSRRKVITVVIERNKMSPPRAKIGVYIGPKSDHHWLPLSRTH